jgi:hypothetical protein
VGLSVPEFHNVQIRTLIEEGVHGMSRQSWVKESVRSGIAVVIVGISVLALQASVALAALPDGRAYEQASPVDKNGGDIQGSIGTVRASSSGNSVMFYAAGGLPGGVGSQDTPTYLAHRGGSSWETHGLLPPSAAGRGAAVRGEDGALEYIYSMAYQPGSPSSRSIFEALGATGSVRPLLQGGLAFPPPFYVGSAANNSIVALEEAEGGSGILVINKATGQKALAGILNDETLPEGGVDAGPWNYSGSEIGGGAQGGYYTEDEHALSEDGSRLYFSASETGQIYTRENLFEEQSLTNGGGACTQSGLACTVLVSEANEGVTDPNAPQPADFIGATPDGSNAFFLSSGKLTSNATTGLADAGKDLYRFEASAPAGHRLTDLTPEPGVGSPNGAEVQGVLGLSDDGSNVYFVANAPLGTGATAGSCAVIEPGKVQGICNLYVWHNGVTDFIAKLKPEGENGDVSDWRPNAAPEREATARVSPDGGVLVFSSLLKQGSYENEGLEELYRYEVGSSQIQCLSCLLSGLPPQARSALTLLPGTDVPPMTPAGFIRRNLSENGTKVFFDTANGLLPEDTNGVNDVYEWEAPNPADSSDSCHETQQNGGCLSLISTGTSPVASYFIDASATGSDVFFLTRQSLVKQDKDELQDVYDARVGGGLAGQNLAPFVPCMSGEACLGAPASSGSEAPRATATFSGPGDKKPPKCKKGFVRKGEKCVKKHQRKKSKGKHKKKNQAKNKNGRS